MILITENETFADATDFNEENNLVPMGYGISVPEARKNMVEVPGRNGLLDLTNALGVVTYGNRNVWFSSLMVDEDITRRFSELLNKYHGQRCKIVFDVEPEYYYDGRCSVSRKQVDSTYQIVQFDLDADPLKYPVYASDEEWLWDPFNFNTGVIRNYGNMVVNGTLTVDVIGYEQPESPKIYVTLNSGQSNMRMVFGGKTYYLNNGLNSFADLIVQSLDVTTDLNRFVFYGYGKVSINIKGGIL